MIICLGSNTPSGTGELDDNAEDLTRQVGLAFFVLLLLFFLVVPEVVVVFHSFS